MAKQVSGRRLLNRWLAGQRGRASLLAEKLGVTRQAVSSWARGVTRPLPHLRELIAAVTGGAVPVAAWGMTPSEAAAAERLMAIRPEAA